MPTLDLIILYRIIKILATPWKEQEAYKLGIIDGRGKVLRSYSTLSTSEERSSFTLLHRFIFNLKRLIELVPGGKSKIGTYAAALFLLREEINFQQLSTLKEEVESGNPELNSFFEMFLLEDGEVPANNAGAGQIAGLGIGPEGEPPKRKKKKFLEKTEE